MASAKKKFLRANTYNQIETATDALIARTTDEVRISEKLVDKGYMNNLLMAIHSELPQSELTYEDLELRRQGHTVIKQSDQQVSCKKENGFYALRIKDLFLTVSTDEELKDANERLATGDINGYQVPKDKSSFQQMDNMTLSLSLSVNNLHLTRTETHFVVTAP